MRFSLVSILVLLVACDGGEKAGRQSVEKAGHATPAAPAEQTVDTTRSESPEAAIAAANEVIERAAALGHAWTTSDQLLARAREASAAGEADQAISLADEARIQADLAIRQARIEADLWQQNVIGND